MKKICSLLAYVILCICMSVPQNVLAQENNPAPGAASSVVYIAAGIEYDSKGQCYTLSRDGTYSHGTGFCVGDKNTDAEYFVTNCHVVFNDNTGEVYEHVYLLIDGAELSERSSVIQCKVLYADAKVDIAVIKTEAPIEGIPGLPLFPAEKMNAGDTVYALGYPGIADAVADDLDYTVKGITVTQGIISRYLVSDGIKCMAQTAEVNRGNSGGPLINSSGQVVGINTFIYTDTSTADLRCYAIYADYAMEVLDELGIDYVDGSKVSETKPEPAEPESEKPNYAGYAAAAAAVVIAAAAGTVAVKNIRKKSTNNHSSGKPTAAPGVTYTVYVMSGPLTGRSYQLTGNRSLKVGRDPSCDIVFPADTKAVSREHCCIECVGNEITVMDLGSTYGTEVNGTKLVSRQRIRIPRNSEIYVGSQGNKLAIR